MKSILLLAILMSAGITSRAAIVINNFDFEAGGLPDGDFSNNFSINPAAAPTGWTLTPVRDSRWRLLRLFQPLE